MPAGTKERKERVRMVGPATASWDDQDVLRRMMRGVRDVVYLGKITAPPTAERIKAMTEAALFAVHATGRPFDCGRHHPQRYCLCFCCEAVRQ